MDSRKIWASDAASSARNGRSANCGALIARSPSPLPLGERVASEASRERGNCATPTTTPLPPSRLPPLGHPLPQGERGRKVGARRTSSRDLPGRAVLRILKHDANRRELVADAVGFLEVLG